MFELLNHLHNRTDFDCGNHEINHYLKTMANQHHKKGIAKVHILSNGNCIIGFYTLANLHIENNGQLKGYPKKVPAIVIGRMGVDKNYQGQGYSKQLIAHALTLVKQIAMMSGVAYVIIDAKDDPLADYYQRLGFLPSDEPYRLVMNANKLL